MSRPRRRMFGPLFYITAAIAVLLAALVHIDTSLPMLAEWRRDRALIGALRGDNSREREAAVAALVLRDSRIAVPYLLEAAHDSRGELRAFACRHLVESGA